MAVSYAPNSPNSRRRVVWKTRLNLPNQSPSSQKKLKVPVELVDIIKGGKRMERERTLMDHGVGFGFVLYLKVEEGEHYVDLTGVVAEGDGGTRVRVVSGGQGREKTAQCRAPLSGGVRRGRWRSNRIRSVQPGR